jgi:hypothetical protein
MILFFLEFVSKAWYTCKACLMGARLLSRVELMLWVRGVTIKRYQSLGYDSVDVIKLRL